MKSGVIIALVAVVALALIARGCSERKEDAATKVEMTNNAAAGDKSQPAEFSLSAKDDEGFDLPEREEVRKTLKLAPEKVVFVREIEGRVRVETADADIAEVLVVRSARKREDLRYRRVIIREDESLYIKVENDGERASSLDSVPESRERVILKLPRGADLRIHEINGGVTVGETNGDLEISWIVGAVRVARAAGPINLGAINGDVDVTFAPLRANSVRIWGDINGNVDLRFEGEVNADLNTWSVNGAIKPDLPNVEIRESGWGKLKARKRIGNGGSVIEVHDVNGNVTLSRAGDAATEPLKAAAK
ncbi:MAG: hypothetical protein ACREAM_24150 [Blastocatellia bacterium]